MKNWSQLSSNQKFGVAGGGLTIAAVAYYYLFNKGYYDKWMKKGHNKV